MMKNFKLFLLSFALIAGLFTSCSNEDSVTEDQNIQETEAITTSLNRLTGQFDDNGDVIPTANPAGNIVFDFGFDFVYPLNLSFNNGTTVSINSLDELIEVLINSTDDLFINGIEFPFDVEVYDEDTDSIVIITINSEEEFLDLLDDLWDSEDPCDCDDNVDPVCVEIQDPNGESFIITYPNECYALCDGFTPNDFSDNCEEDYNCPGGFECFEFNFPITIITDEDVTITVNSQEELDNTLYNTYYFDFVYPFDVTTEEGDIETIYDDEDFYDLLEDCFDDYDDECYLEVDFIEDALMLCDVYELEIYTLGGDIVDVNYVEFNANGELVVNGTPTVVDLGSWSITNSNDNTILTIEGLQTFALLNGEWELDECEGYELEFINGDYTIEIDLDCDNVVEPCEECENEEFVPVCVEVEMGGQIVTYTFPNACYAECEGFTENDFVDCENDIPNNCSEQEVFAYLLQCQWYLNTSLYDATVVQYAQFFQDGTVTMNDGSTGTWNTSSNPSTEEVFVFFTFNNAPYDAVAQLDWTVGICSEGYIVLESGNEFVMLERDCE